MDGWQALGWTAHPPELAGGDGEDGDGSPVDPPDPPAALPTVTAIKGGPFVVKGEVVEAYVVGTASLLMVTLRSGVRARQRRVTTTSWAPRS